jgi:hypothetical protein
MQKKLRKSQFMHLVLTVRFRTRLAALCCTLLKTIYDEQYSFDFQPTNPFMGSGNSRTVPAG